MLVYIIFIILILILPKMGKIRIVSGFKTYGFNVAFILIFILSALRFDVGYDYSMYYEFIEGNIKWYTDQINRIEFLPRQLILFSSFINFYQFFFIFTSFLITYFFYKGIKENSEDRLISTLIFVCFPLFFFMSLSIVRQYVAVAIVFYSFKFIKQRQFWQYLAVVILCFFIHKSFILALPLYFFYSNFVNKKIILVIFILSFFSSDLLAFVIKLFSDRYSIYFTRISGEGGNLMLLVFQTLGLLLLPLVYNFRDKNDKDFNFYLLTYFVGLFIWASLSKFGHAGIRGSLYYMSFTILLIPHLKKKIKEYKIIKEGFVIICICFFFINLYIGSQHRIKDANLPYQTFFFKTPKDFKPNE